MTFPSCWDNLSSSTIIFFSTWILRAYAGDSLSLPQIRESTVIPGPFATIWTELGPALHLQGALFPTGGWAVSVWGKGEVRE